MSITISTYSWAKRHKRDFSALITVEDPTTRRPLRFHNEPRLPHLVLPFADLDYPVPAPFDSYASFRLASEDQISEAMAFGRQHSNLLIHCQVGIARSPAVAMAIWMDQLRDEDTVFAELLQTRPEAVPNRHVVGLIDKMLGCNLLSRLDVWDAYDPRNRVRRALCRKNYFLDGGIPLELEPELKNVSMWDWIRAK